MKKKIVSLDNIGVKFQLKGNPRESLAQIHKKFFSQKNEFWALKNVSFDVYEGETLFILGRNGAGKSTLLKVIAETLFPDEGQMTFLHCKKSFISMRLGFRPELSGWDNMHVALKVMGLPDDHLGAIKQEIIEFTQLEDFIYEPVENYSAGMRTRLAFAIATSTVPDILIMDEVINTGDEYFRERCQNRLQGMLDKSKAVIVCSHNLQSVEDMATKVLWLDKGRVIDLGEPKIILEKYREYVKLIKHNPKAAIPC